MLEKLGFRQLVEETLTVKRRTKSMPMFEFVLGMVLACYVGFSRLFHLRFLEREPMLTGILQVARLPPQCTFWRFLASLHLGVARQLLQVQRRMRQRVWEAANVQLSEITRAPTPTDSARFGISRRDGARPTGFWRCVTRMSGKPERRSNPSSTSCSTRPNIRIGFS